MAREKEPDEVLMEKMNGFLAKISCIKRDSLPALQEDLRFFSNVRKFNTILIIPSLV